MLRRPDPARPVGDAIPFFDERTGRYHLFYLSPLADVDTLDGRLDRVVWDHVSSADLCRWDKHPTAIAPGPPGSPDAGGILTGSVIRRGDTWHAFYVGARPGAALPQTICHATSTDGDHFTKDPANPILVPTGPFEQRDWRDPFVFWNAAARQYWMLISARSASGPFARRGAVALATSPDLTYWQVADAPILAPLTTLVPECPELLRFGDAWVLGFSAYTGPPGLHHYAADDLAGPWQPARGYTDGATWYAAKSLVDEQGRVLSFAWIADRVGKSDEGVVLWGGDFATVRELWRGDDGAMGHRLPAEVRSAFARRVPITLAPRLGNWHGQGGALASGDGYLHIADLRHSAVAGATMLSAAIDWTVGSDAEAGVLLHASPDLDAGVQLVISPATRTVALYALSTAWTHLVDKPYGPWVRHTLSRPLEQPVKVDIIVDGACIEVFVNNAMSLSHRFYRTLPAPFALYATGKGVRFSSVTVGCEP